MEYQMDFTLSCTACALTGDWQMQNADTAVFLLNESESAPVVFTQNNYLNELLNAIYAKKSFTGKSESLQIIPVASVAEYSQMLLAGLGEISAFTAEKQRRLGGLIAKKLKELKSKNAVLVLPEELNSDAVREITVGLYLASYKFKDFKLVQSPVEPWSVSILMSKELVEAAQKAIADAAAIVEGVNTARTLVNLPPNYCTPEYMADTARKIGERVNLKVSVLDKPAIEAEKMHAFLSVNLGSHHPPQFIIMEHEGVPSPEQETIVLVGKAVTFDTGGYSLKSGDGMATMKSDMAGGAAVLGAMLTIGVLKPAVRVIALVPTTENKISENAYLPQEVITAANGKTIEIISTDAEGRMTLADTLVYADRYKPTAVIDIATLTGACVTALGGVAAGLFTSDDKIKNDLLKSAESTNEKLWPLPMFEEYQKQIDSPIADLKNSGGKMGGVGSSALFLKHFINYSWAHIDMAGLSGDVTEKPYNLPKNASGYGVRLFVDFVMNR